jgi:hypothetical protein
VIAAIGTERRKPRYFAESDGEPHAKTHYVTHTTHLFREDCPTREKAKTRAKELNDYEARIHLPDTHTQP